MVLITLMVLMIRSDTLTVIKLTTMTLIITIMVTVTGSYNNGNDADGVNNSDGNDDTE